jgi:hypothetical protein
VSERLVLTPGLAAGQGWTVMARCDHCQVSRSALGAWRRTAKDRDLIDALEHGRMSCMKCRRPCRALYVGKAWPGGGYQRIMTIRMGACVEIHDESPTYPEPPPGIGSST